MTKPFYVQGVGAVTPLGHSWAATWAGLLQKATCVVSANDAGVLIEPDVLVAAVSDVDRSIVEGDIGPAARLIDEALAQLSCPLDELRSCWGGSNHGEASKLELHPRCVPAGVMPLLSTKTSPPPVWVASACASGLHALYFAMGEAQTADGDWLVVGGDALSASGIAGFYRAGATGSGLPTPLREGSGGMLVSEGAVALHLTTTAVSPTPAILAMAMSCDAGHPTHPDPSGHYLEDAIRTALDRARLRPADVLVVVAHGTGTDANDSVEADVLSRIWAGHPLVVTSPKGNIGHVMGAAGLVNVAIAASIWETGTVPAVPGNGRGRNGLHVPESVTRIPAHRPVLVVASGFGGNNVAAVIV